MQPNIKRQAQNLEMIIMGVWGGGLTAIICQMVYTVPNAKIWLDEYSSTLLVRDKMLSTPSSKIIFLSKCSQQISASTLSGDHYLKNI